MDLYRRGKLKIINSCPDALDDPDRAKELFTELATWAVGSEIFCRDEDLSLYSEQWFSRPVFVCLL